MTEVDKPQPEQSPWQSDAEREGLPVSNALVKSGVERLNVDDVLRKSLPDYVKEKH